MRAPAASTDGPLRLAIVTWFGGGNIRPVLATAGQLVDRGHEVHVLTNPALAGRVAATGARPHNFTGLPPHDPATPSSDVVRAYEGRTIAERNALIARRLVFGPAPVVCNETIALIEAHDPHVVICDYVLVGAMTAAEARGKRCVVVSDGMYPLPVPQQPHPASPYAVLFARMVRTGLPMLNDMRAAQGLPPLDEPTDLYRSAARFIVMTYDVMARSPGPPFVRYAGPQFPPPTGSALPEQQGRRFVLGSFSTIHTEEQASLIQRLTEALAELDVDALVATGSTTAETIRTPHSSVRVEDHVDLERYLPRASLLVSHAGNGTIVRGLAHGVPQLCIPFIQDQHDYARRLAQLGVAHGLRKTASTRECREAIADLLQDSGPRVRARRLAEQIARRHRPASAARYIEEVAHAAAV